MKFHVLLDTDWKSVNSPRTTTNNKQKNNEIMNKIILFFIVNIVIIENIRCDVRRDEKVTKFQRQRVKTEKQRPIQFKRNINCCVRHKTCNNRAFGFFYHLVSSSSSKTQNSATWNYWKEIRQRSNAPQFEQFFDLLHWILSP